MGDRSGPWILAAAILGSSMAFIDGTVINVALPALQAVFHTDGSRLQWIVEAYALSLASLLLLGGSFGDLYGRKKMFMLGVLIFACASMICGSATSSSVIIISRAVQGIGGALLVPGSLALISASFPEKSRGQAIGIWSGSTAVTASVGPLLGGWLIQHASWRWIFFLNLPIAVAVLAVCAWKVPESRNPSATKPDWLGAYLAAAGLGACVFALIEGGDRPLKYLGVGIIGALLVAGFVIWEWRSDRPMMPLALFRSRSFSTANCITLLIYASLSGVLYYLPMQLIQIQRYPADKAGAVLLPMTILIAVLSRWTGGLVKSMGGRLPIALGAVLTAGGYGLLLLLKTNGSYTGTVLPGVFLLGLGLAVLVAPLTTTVMNSVARDRGGTASGINNAIASVASLLAISVFGVVFSSSFANHLRIALRASSLPTVTQREIFAHHNELGGMVASSSEVQQLVDQAFVESLHLILILALSLSVLAAITSAFLEGQDTEHAS
jgi:EmrB/QacA subfamily drug resistance transporter